MRLMILVLLGLISCRVERPHIGNAGKVEDDLLLCEGSNTGFSRRSVHCLRNFIVGEDGGGIWEQIGTTPEDLSELLIGENPCFEWNDKACGQYHLMYIVGDPCCYDTAFVSPIKCCLKGISNCE